MNTLWLKIASGVIVILVLIIAISVLMSSGEKEPSVPVSSQEPNNEDSFSDFMEQIAEDEEGSTISEEGFQPVIEESQTDDIVSSEPEIVQPVPVKPQVIEMTIYVKKPNSAEEDEAIKQFDYAKKSFDVGRLPTTSYNPAIVAARRIIERWPESIYAFQSKLLLAQIPKNFQEQYNITSQELDTSMFSEPRAGTIPVKIKFEDQS